MIFIKTFSQQSEKVSLHDWEILFSKSIIPEIISINVNKRLTSEQIKNHSVFKINLSSQYIISKTFYMHDLQKSINFFVFLKMLIKQWILFEY